MGQDPDAQAFIQYVPSEISLRIPAICFMEGFSAFEDFKKRRNQLRNSVELHIKDIRDDRISAHAAQLLANLRQSLIDNDNLMNDSQLQLQQAMHGMSQFAEIIVLDNQILAASLATTYIDDPTDNLILHTILADARGCNATRIAFISNNTRDFGARDIRQLLLETASVYFFADLRSFQGWYQADMPGTANE